MHVKNNVVEVIMICSGEVIYTNVEGVSEDKTSFPLECSYCKGQFCLYCSDSGIGICECEDCGKVYCNVHNLMMKQQNDCFNESKICVNCYHSKCELVECLICREKFSKESNNRYTLKYYNCCHLCYCKCKHVPSCEQKCFVQCKDCGVHFCCERKLDGGWNRVCKDCW